MIFFMCVSILPTCVLGYHVRASKEVLFLWKAHRGGKAELQKHQVADHICLLSQEVEGGQEVGLGYKLHQVRLPDTHFLLRGFTSLNTLAPSSSAAPLAGPSAQASEPVEDSLYPDCSLSYSIHSLCSVSLWKH